ncbi:MAG: FAD-dependent oxidoreductase, partial [Pseudomonadota bacterium]
MRTHARVVVIGGGNMGAGVLYHLAHAGWTDCVLIEKAELTSGATWHAAGLVSRMVGGHALGSLHDYAVDLYQRIEAETGVSVSYHGCGSLRVATSDAHVDWVQHLRDAILARGQTAELIPPAEVAALNPLYDVEAAGVRAALYTPDDGHVDPSGTCQAMIKGARQLGAEVLRHCRVLDTRQRPGGEWAVVTEQGTIVAEHVVNAAGYHARQVGAMAGLDLPITTLQHHYVITDAVPELAALGHEIPVTRDDHFCGYVRREQASVLIGLYDKQGPQAVWLDGCPWDSANELFEANWDGITPWLENCFERMPALVNRGIKRVVNGGITYTPDGAMLLGPASGLRNYWLACGATVGIAWGPGAGRTLAEWLVEGTAQVSTRAFDPRRFGVWADADYARARATEDYTLRQAMPYPQHQRSACRDQKRSGAHARTAALGACFEEAGGWERPRLYAPEPLGWRRTPAFEQVARECAAVRE